MQFRVPQNIMMEDKILGPLTAIQFGILVLGGGASFLVFTSQSLPSPIGKIVGVCFAILTLILGIGKFNDQPMYRFIRYVVAFIASPKTRIWHKIGKDPVLIKPVQKNADEEQHQVVKHVSRKEISRLANLIDSHGATTNPIIKRKE